MPPAATMDTFFTARLAEWDDAKGYGFLEHEKGRIFLHRKDLNEAGARPRVGDRVRFRMGKDGEGRPCAQDATCPAAGWRKLRRQALLLGGLLVLPLAAVIKEGAAHWLLFLYAAGISTATYVMYAQDKKAAQAGQWRIQELTLHLMSLCGGWPGAWWARQRLRHKSAKKSFSIVFWGIVALYQYAALEVLLGGRMIISLWSSMTGA